MANIDMKETRYADMNRVFKATINYDDDFSGQGGALNPEQQKDIYNRVKNQMRLNGIGAQIFPMRGSGREVTTVDISGRVVEADTGQSSSKRGVTNQQRLLNGKRVKTAFKFQQDAIEQNVAEEQIVDEYLDAFTAAMANGIEKLILLGNATEPPAILESTFNNDRDNTGSTTQYRVDSYYALFDGIIKEAIDNGTVINGANSANVKNLMYQALKGLDPKHQEDPSKLVALMPLDIVTNLRWVISERATALGDLAITESGMLTIAGVPVVPIPNLANRPVWSENLTLNSTTASALTFGYLDEDDVIVTDSTISTTAVSAYTLSTDYSVGETTGTVTRVGTGITDGATVRVTTNVPPLFVLTPAANLLIGLNEDFRLNTDYDADTDTTLFVLRSRVDFQFLEYGTGDIVLVKNIQDALSTS